MSTFILIILEFIALIAVVISALATRKLRKELERRQVTVPPAKRRRHDRRPPACATTGEARDD